MENKKIYTVNIRDDDLCVDAADFDGINLSDEIKTYYFAKPDENKLAELKRMVKDSGYQYNDEIDNFIQKNFIFDEKLIVWRRERYGRPLHKF